MRKVKIAFETSLAKRKCKRIAMFSLEEKLARSLVVCLGMVRQASTIAKKTVEGVEVVHHPEFGLPAHIIYISPSHVHCDDMRLAQKIHLHFVRKWEERKEEKKNVD